MQLSLLLLQLKAICRYQAAASGDVLCALCTRALESMQPVGGAHIEVVEFEEKINVMQAEMLLLSSPPKPQVLLANMLHVHDHLPQFVCPACQQRMLVHATVCCFKDTVFPTCILSCCCASNYAGCIAVHSDGWEV